jgi:hypothetical protein
MELEILIHLRVTFHLISVQIKMYARRNVIATAYFWTNCCMLLTTGVTVRISLFTLILFHSPFRVHLTYIQRYVPTESNNSQCI